MSRIQRPYLYCLCKKPGFIIQRISSRTKKEVIEKGAKNVDADVAGGHKGMKFEAELATCLLDW